MPVSDEQGDLTGLPIFASHAVAVDHDHRGRGNGGPIASVPTEVVPEEQRPVSLSASELAGRTSIGVWFAASASRRLRFCPTS